MKGEPSCPRCRGRLRAPGLWSSAWTCDAHGAVQPLHPAVPPSLELVNQQVKRAAVPVWLPWPLPPGWLVTGLTCAGDERAGAQATVLACSGPAPRGGLGELMLVAEEPGVGLGAHFAGLPGPDPGEDFDDLPAAAKIHAAGHPTALWALDGDGTRATYVGEALGRWLWAVVWPAAAGQVVQDDLHLVDLRDAGHELDLPFGALCPRLGG